MVEKGSGGGAALHGSSVQGMWREGSLVGDPKGQIEKALETGIYFHRGPTGEPGRGFVYWGLLEMDKEAL